MASTWTEKVLNASEHDDSQATHVRRRCFELAAWMQRLAATNPQPEVEGI